MKRRKVTIVGAGLAGLSAAINLARDGLEVLVLDKEKRHGGRPEFRPDGAASAFDLDALQAYTGIDISPACRHMESVVLSVFGRRTELVYGGNSQMYLVERGTRSTSIDTLLYDTAVEAGARFEWDFAIKSPADVAQLPEGSIIATGLDVQGFEAMGIPYVPLWGWYAKGLVEDVATRAWAHIDDFTVDYAFTTQINGAVFSLLFQRDKPLMKRGKDKLERLVAGEGIELEGWRDLVGGASPHALMSRPVLFKNNMIVIGTLAGVMEPMMNFGMLGALICGKIGASAVHDSGEAYEEFKRLTSFFGPSMRAKRVHDRMPPAARRVGWRLFSWMQDHMSDEQNERAFRFIPGYGNF